MKMSDWGIWDMSRVSLLISNVVDSLISSELKRSFGLLGMIGFSFSIVTSSVAFPVTNCSLCTH